ncbi:MAG: transcription termination factor Rho [Ilumatobacteraceae bacterium]|nr:transcription termination factor Rho [Ilumatobacteraceae bacterium]
MTAQALEQSVLESKDKTQLIAIAEALGVKASARNKKADIIGQILSKTGGSSGGSDAAPATASAASSAPAKAAATPPPPPDPADEPKAEWELQAEQDGGDADAGHTEQRDTKQRDTKQRETEQDSAQQDGAQQSDRRDGSKSADQSGGRRDDTKRDDTKRDEQRDESKSGSDSSDAKQDDRSGGQQSGDGKQDQGNRQQRDQGGRNQNRNNNRNNQGGNDGDGESRNKRRRRRRKGRGGQDGPQGEDRELLESDDDTNEPQSNEPVKVDGYLDLRDEGYGFVRVNNYLASKSDSYIPVKLSRQYGLRKGDHVVGMSRPAGRNEKNPAMLEIHSVNGRPPEEAKKRPRFEDLTALFPDSQLRLEDPSDPTNMTARIIDLVSPIGKGQRGIIVSPPKAGKTSVMKTVVASVEKNNPEVKVIVLLIDERPEEVTDMKRMAKGEVIASTFDKPSDQHTQIAEMTIEKAKRMVEYGDDVLVVLDGITRLARAYNLAAPASGRILSGGIDAGALYPPKRFFGAARNVEEGGSLTILATALVETNSRMDEAVFEEFKGTGNMELRLDRKLAERRIYPAIDVDASSTRHEELLFDRKQLQMVWKLRRVLSGLAADGNAAPGLELLVDRLKTFRTNEEFLTEIAKQPGM